MSHSSATSPQRGSMMLVSWNITKACNLTCEHCYRDAGSPQPDELTLAEGITLLDELAKLGFRMVIFSGGEPLLRSELYDWIRHAQKQGLISVLGSNGTLLNEERARRLKEAGLKRVGISLDSIDPQQHDRFRGSVGAWQLAVRGMEHAVQAGLEFQIHTTVTTKNIAEVLAITDFAQQRGAKAHHIFFLVATGRGKRIDDVIPAAAAYEALLEKILVKQKTVSVELKPVCAPQFVRISRQKKLATRFEKGCLTGSHYACILPNGDVHPCPYMPVLMGNVRRPGGFTKIWQEHPVFTQLRAMEYKGKCGVCEFRTLCSGCRAAAYNQSSGDYLASDENCPYEPKTAQSS